MRIYLRFGSALLGGAALCVLSVASPALAQTAQQATPQTDAPTPADSQGPATGVNANQPGDEIVVTGIRRSLADAIAIKRDSSAIVDAISAESIGKFPDQNLAESLQRVTGVQIQRANGEGTRISVRGLSPDFTRTQYNGRTITSNGGRSFDFSSLSSDFVSAVEVYKTPTADLIDGGLSATVNVRVARPLDAGKDRYLLAGEGIYEGNSKKAAPHFTGFANKLFDDGKVGVYFGADYRQRKYTTFNELGFGQEYGVEATRNPPIDYNLDGDFKDTFRFENALGTNIVEGDTRRLNLVGGVQVKPTERLELWADAFYADLKDTQTSHNAIARFTSISGPNAAVRGSVIDGSLIKFLDADGVWLQSSAGTSDTRTVTISPAVGATWRSGGLTISAEGNYSRTRTESTSLGVEAIGRASVSYDLRPDGSTFPDIKFTRGWDPLNPHNFRGVGGGGNYKAPTIDRNWTAKGDVGYKFNGDFLKKIAAGVNLSDRLLSYRSSSIRISAQQYANLLGLPYDPNIEGGSFDAASISRAWSFPNAFSNYSGPAHPITQGVSTTTDLILQKVSWATILAAAPPQSSPASDYSVDERSFAAYGRVDIGAFHDRLSGNIGLRYVRTMQSSIGSVPDFNNITFILLGAQTLVGAAPAGLVKNNYDEWLPSLNFKYSVNKDIAIRFAAARVMTRPTLGLLTTSTNINANVRNISSGNPRLAPFLATQADLSLEYYFGKTGLLSAAFFYKDIKNFVVNATANETYPVHIGVGGPIQNIAFSHFFPDNGAGAKLKGVELSAQLPLSFLPSPLDGFGVLLNATFLDVGKVTPNSGGPASPLPGVSNNAYNAEVYYEKYGFGARLSYTYRGKFTNDPLSYFGDGDFARSYGQLDGSISYDINKHIGLNVDASNILNNPQITYDNFNIVRTYEDSGFRITAGARVRF